METMSGTENSFTPLSFRKIRYVAWGEYPLCFAAVLGQEECYRLILSRGANHDLADSNGNTVTHILVVYDNMVRERESSEMRHATVFAISTHQLFSEFHEFS